MVGAEFVWEFPRPFKTDLMQHLHIPIVDGVGDLSPLYALSIGSGVILGYRGLFVLFEFFAFV